MALYPKQRIFVVDDEHIIAMTLAAILSYHGYDARHFTDPLKALEAINNECPNLLISDVMMAGLTGVELAIQVKALYPTCRIVLISGNAATADLLYPALIAGHHFEVHAKPITPPNLIAIIQATAN